MQQGSVGKKCILTTIGFACQYSIAIVFFYYDWLFDLSYRIDPLQYGLTLNASLCASAAIAYGLSKRTASGRPIAVVGAASYAIAFGSLAIAQETMVPELLYLVGIGAGFGAGFLMPLWFERASRIGGRRGAYVLGIASIVSALGALLSELLDVLALAVVCALLLACSLGLLAHSRRSESERDEASGRTETAKGDTTKVSGLCGKDARSLWLMLAVPLLYVFLLSIIYGVLDVVAMAAPRFDATDSGSASQIGGLVTDVVFLLYVRYGAKRYATMLNGALGIIATGLVFLPFVSGAYSIVLVVLTHMGWEMSLLVSYTLVIETFRGRKDFTGAAAVVFAFPRPGVMIGVGIASFVAVDSQYAFAQMTIIAFSLLYLIMMGVWLLRTRERRAAEKAIRKRDDLIRRYAQARDDLFSMACDELAVEHKLTKRETELLRLLAQGRDAAYIEKELYLSRNTVKSYTRSLYAKLGVHSKQELIDAVKTLLPLD